MGGSFRCVGEPCPCTDREFKCVTTGTCIPENAKCNQTFECSDKSDERDCGQSTLDLSVFMEASLITVIAQWFNFQPRDPNLTI